MFASSRFIPNLMKDFEEECLKKYTPTHNFEALDQLAEALAVVHVEFILIHPFREGNGRLARVICDLMVLQAGFPKLSYQTLLDGNLYIDAIHKGVSKNYSLMIDIFKRILNEAKEK